ncbi:DUF262 domain-containing protein [Methylobacterium sp. Leaf102]|uniref:DUF262 domain-containing protein n=1 Tax=Methylobacterium sp. Leaf102 TaxID=1736253 RepID=UPI0009E98A8C|nr:DUF262 domain-containing protein [Methylobacterium sp. Leaf102]
MKASSAPVAVGDYCSAMIDQKITVNREYQRSPQVWRGEARSFFVETILLGYPIPKLFLYSKLDLRTRTTIKDIVDGQQRSMALLDFYNNKFRLSKNIDTEELKGKNYNQLDDEWKEAFLTYSLPIDQFAGVSESEVRQAFRRMNSNNVPLNDEEKRNARYQGEFKWMIHSLATEYKDAFFRAGLLSRRDLIRMADYKFITDIAFAINNGIHTTKSKELDSIYAKYDKDFPFQDHIYSTIKLGLDALLSLVEYYGTDFFKAHVAYAIVLAAIALNQGDGPVLQSIAGFHPDQYHDIEVLRLPDLISLLAAEYDDSLTHPFYVACSQKTNVKEPRCIRTAYFFNALRLRQNEAND